jgi:Fe-S-cluster containining protein
MSDAYTNQAEPDDVARWRKEGRKDILAWLYPIPSWKNPVLVDLWVSPKTGEDVDRCPWLRKLPRQNKYICRIQETKPVHCRNYPKTPQHGKETGCPACKGLK